MRSPDPFAAPLVDSLTRSARAFGAPGLAIAAVAPGRRTLLLDGACAQDGRPVDQDTWFSVASLGKHVTAAAVLALAQRAGLALTAPIGQLLPDTPAAWRDRSVLSLLRHSSGLAEYLSPNPQVPVPVSRAGFMSRYAMLSPAFAEGAGWMYTNTNYILLGLLVAQASAGTYADAVQAIFRQVACDGAAVAGPQWARQVNAGAISRHAPDSDCVGRDVIGDGDVCFTPAGALRWLEVLIDGNLLDASHDSLMFSAGPLATGRPSGYGCGWFVEPMGDATLAYHGGHFDGWTSMAIINRMQGSGVVVMCNHAPGHTRAVRHLAQVALEGYAPGSTPLSLPVLDDAHPDLARRIGAQLLREPGTSPDPSCLDEELLRVAEHGNPVRTVPNLSSGALPRAFELVQRQTHTTHTWHRYRLTYPDRIEHVMVGTTPRERLFWAWPL